jgi:hypothetical protein
MEAIQQILSDLQRGDIKEVAKNLPEVKKIIDQKDIERRYTISYGTLASDDYTYTLIVLKNKQGIYIERIGGFGGFSKILGPLN